MSPLFKTFGLRASLPLGFPPNYTATFLITNFAFSYLFFSSRTGKQYHHSEHNSCPREDIAKYGERMVVEGKITRSNLNMIKRWKAAHANTVENYPLFVSGVIMCLHTKVPVGTLNGLNAGYALAGEAYGFAYVSIGRENYSIIKSHLWWIRNICCLTMIGMARKRLQLY